MNFLPCINKVHIHILESKIVQFALATDCKGVCVNRTIVISQINNRVI